MICNKCNSVNEDGSNVCKECGNTLYVQTKKKQKGFKGIFFLIVLVLALAASYYFYDDYSKTINLNDFVSATFSGGENHGKAEVKVDWDGVKEKYGSKITLKKVDVVDLANAIGVENTISSTTPADVLSKLVSLDLDKETDLKNGDVIKYNFKIDYKNIKKLLNCKIKHRLGTLTVSGLSDAQTIDPFDGFSIEYEGDSKQAVAKVKYTGKHLDVSEFKLDKTANIRNGDIITITLANEDDYYVNKYGVIPSTNRKDIIVSGLKEEKPVEEVGSSEPIQPNSIEGLLCSYCSTRNISEDEIKQMLNKDYSSYNFPGDRTIIQMVINELYAVHGTMFVNQDVQEYFNQKSWYAQLPSKSSNKDEVYKNMSKIEKDNIALLTKYR